MPAVELALLAGVLLAGRLQDQALGLAQRVAQGFLHGQAQGAHLAAHFTLQAAHDGALALDHFAHALVLTGVGVAARFVAQQLALFGVGLLELNALGLGRLDQFGACRAEQLAVGGVGNGFLLDGGVNDDLAELTLGDEFQGDRHFNGAGQQFFNAFFTDELAKLDQQGGVARPAVLKVGQAGEVLPGGRLAPALADLFVALVEGVFEVEQGGHQAKRQAGPPGVGKARAAEGNGGAKEVHVVQVFDLLTNLGLAGKAVGQRSFDLLPGHATGQHRQGMAQVNHVVQTAAKEIVGAGGHGNLSKTPRNSI